jgi:hypothetical protein
LTFAIYYRFGSIWLSFVLNEILIQKHGFFLTNTTKENMKTYTKYLLISYAFSVVLTATRAFSKTDPYSFLEHTYFLIAMGAFVASFAYAGKMFRDFVMPDAVLTTGAVDTFKQKVFWMVGPQIIGAVIGMIATHGLHKTLFLDKANPAPAYQAQRLQQESNADENAEIDPSTLSEEKQ